MNAVTPTKMDKQSFYRWLEQQERRHEFVEGLPRMMTGASRNHNDICFNLAGILSARLDRANWHTMIADFAVEIGDHIRYSDIVVEPRTADGARYHADAPVFIVEVQSSASLYVDLTAKAEEYRSLSTLDTYAVLSQDNAFAWVWTRVDGVFTDRPVELDGLGATLDVPALTLSLPLAEIYASVPLKS